MTGLQIVQACAADGEKTLDVITHCCAEAGDREVQFTQSFQSAQLCELDLPMQTLNTQSDDACA